MLLAYPRVLLEFHPIFTVDGDLIVVRKGSNIYQRLNNKIAGLPRKLVALNGLWRNTCSFP